MKQRRTLLWGCGSLLVICTAVVFILNPVQLVLSAFGLSSRTGTDALLAAQATQVPPSWGGLGNVGYVGAGNGDGGLENVAEGDVTDTAVVVQPETVQAVPSLTVKLDGRQGNVDVAALKAIKVEQGTTNAGETAFFIEYDEPSVNALVDTMVAQYDLPSQVRNIVAELRPGAVVVRAEADTQYLGWQDVALVLAFSATGQQFEVAGLEIAGQSFETPPQGFIADFVERVEVEGNRALQNVAVVDEAGHTAVVQQVYITEDLLQIVMH